MTCSRYSRSVRALVIAVVLVACGTSSKPAPEPAPAGAASNVHIDRRVELISIVCALAGFKEYTLGQVNPYRTDVVQAFRTFVQHPAVVRARELRAQHGIGYDAPMILAVHLDDQLQLFNAAELPRIDARWADVDVAAYAALLRDFARDTKLDEFLAAHRAHYTKVEDALRGAVDAEKPIAWFDAVFGKRAHARYTVIPSPMTGTYNFGVRATTADGTLEMYQLIGVDTPTGLPVINDDLVWLLVHEMAHSYINPALAQHEAELAAPAQKLFAKVEREMTAQAYGTWQIFLNEAVVRATTVRYLHDRKGAAAADAVLAKELERGFRWTRELAELMAAYQQDHQDYVPRLVALLGSV